MTPRSDSKRPLTLYVLEQLDAPLALSPKQLTQLRQLAVSYGRRLVALLDELQQLDYSLCAIKSSLRPDQFALRRLLNRSTELKREFEKISIDLYWQACKALSPEQQKAFTRYFAA